MIRQRVTYIMIVATCLWLCLLYTFQGLRFFLGILLAVPAVCLIFLLLRAPWCRVDMGEIPANLERGEKVTVPVRVSYRGILPLPGLRINLIWTVDGARRKTVRRMIRGMNGRCVKELPVEFLTEHCGQADFRVGKAWIFDSLGLFRLRIRARGQAALLVTPVISPLSQGEAAFVMNYLKICREWEDGDYYIREYRPGDMPRSIHWKLTAREGELQVKDIQPDTAVRFFLHMTDEMLGIAGKRDAYLDKACSVLAFLAEQTAAGFDVSWPRSGMICHCRIYTGKDIFLCIRELVTVRKAGEALPEDVERCCRLEPDGRLYLGEQCADEE